VLRVALLSRLNLGLDQKLTMVSAPAGYCKTTLVCEWIARRRVNANLPPDVCLALDPEDNDPVRFLCYPLSACQSEYSLESAPLEVLKNGRLVIAPGANQVDLKTCQMRDVLYRDRFKHQVPSTWLDDDSLTISIKLPQF
jgi:hypothetical protein